MTGDREGRWDGGLFPRRRTDLDGRQLDGGWPHLATHAARIELPGGRQASGAARRAVAEALAGVATETELADLRMVVGGDRQQRR